MDRAVGVFAGAGDAAPARQRSLHWTLALVFFCGLPVAYAAQVISGQPAVGILFWLPLLLAVASYALQPGVVKYLLDGQRRTVPDTIVLLAVLAGLFWTAVDGLAAGAGMAGRYLLLYVAPLGIYFMAAHSHEDRAEPVFGILVIAGLLVGTEMLYENVSVRVFQHPTWFQLENHLYVLAGSGRSLSQLYVIAYRPPGLLEHVHATTAFVSASATLGWCLYLARGKLAWLVLSLFGTTAVLLHGSRLVTLVLLVVLASAYAAFRRNATRSELSRINRGAAALVALIALLALTDPLGTFGLYYGSAMTGDFGIAHGLSYTDVLLMAVHRVGAALREYPVAWLAGVGMGALMRGTGAENDDVFPLQLIAEHGIVGFALFAGLTLWLMWRGVLAAMRASPAERLVPLGAVTIILVILGTTVHSGTLQRKSIYPVFFLALGVLEWHRRREAKLSPPMSENPCAASPAR